jgi:hypothetical protein
MYEISGPRFRYLGLKMDSYKRSCPIAKLGRHIHGTYEITGSSKPMLVFHPSTTILTDDTKLQ